MDQPKRYFVGLDLGQASDHTALAVLERPLVKPGAAPGLRRPPCALRHLHRLRTVFSLGRGALCLCPDWRACAWETLTFEVF